MDHLKTIRAMDSHEVNSFACLTDAILLIIISFLPFKEAAKTCILSKRWRNLWRSTSNIEFDQSFFTMQPRLASSSSSSQRQSLINFARQWMLNYREPVVHRFRLSVSYSNEFRLDVERWILFVISRNVKELDLDLSDQEWIRASPEDHHALFTLPSDVYGHCAIRSLKLSACDLQVSNLVNFTALGELSLGWIELTCSSLQFLMLNCPSLKILSLKKCRNLSYIDISAPGLRLIALYIEDCSPLSQGIIISVSSLRFLKYFGSLEYFYLENLWCLEEAEFDFGREDELEEVGDYLYNILHGLDLVKVLTVCSYMTQALPCGTEPMSLSPPLYGVTRLILKTGLHTNELPGIAFLLRSCPLLEILSIEMGVAKGLSGYESPYPFNRRHFWSTDVIIGFNCVKRKLRVVEVKNFKGQWTELQILAYLLNKGGVLEMVSIDISKEINPNGGSVELYRRNARRLLEIKPASPFVRLLIS